MDPNPRTAQAGARNEPLCLLFYAHDVPQAAVLVDPHVISKEKWAAARVGDLEPLKHRLSHPDRDT